MRALHWFRGDLRLADNTALAAAAATSDELGFLFVLDDALLASPRVGRPELRDAKAQSIHQPWREPLLCRDYPAPIVDHAERRRIALVRFEEARRAAPLA